MVSANGVIGIMMILVFCAYLLPVGMDALAATNISTWSTAEQALFPLIGLFALIAIVAGLANRAD